jgi:hypothetical protein
MMFLDLVEQQWSNYSDRHRNRRNLLIHVVAVPVLWLGAFQLLGGLFLVLLGVPGAFGMLAWGAVFIGVSLFAQAQGHSGEAIEPEKFADAGNFARRLFAEQFINFPRFVLSGGWLRNVRGASGPGAPQ